MNDEFPLMNEEFLPHAFMRENLFLSMFPSLKTITFLHGSAGVGVGGVGGVVHERDPPFSLMNAPFMRAALMK